MIIRNFLILAALVLLVFINQQNVYCQDEQAQHNQFEQIDKKFDLLKQEREERQQQREQRMEQMRQEREKAMNNAQKDFQSQMQELDSKLTQNMQKFGINRNEEYFSEDQIKEKETIKGRKLQGSEEIIQDDGINQISTDSQQNESNDIQKNTNNNNDIPGDHFKNLEKDPHYEEWKAKRDKERERDKMRRQKQREREMDGNYEMSKEEFDQERKERRERREEKRREREERKEKMRAKKRSRRRGSDDDDFSEESSDEEHLHHDMEDMMDDMEIREIMHMQNRQFGARKRKGNNDKPGQETIQIILAGLDEQQYPFTQYIHSGNSTYNWEIDYNRRTRRDNIQIVFGDSRYERLTHSYKYLYNYLMFHEAYSDKYQLTHNLRILDKSKKYRLNSDDFHPQSYLINMQYQDYSENELDFLDAADGCNHYWIEKPNNSAGSLGIRVHKDVDTFIRSMKIRKERARKKNAEGSSENDLRFDKFRSVTIQEYINHPLKIGDKKCDLTHQVLTFYTGENWIYFLYNNPNARCAQEEYKKNKNKLNNNKIHLTNLEKIEKEYYYLEDEDFEELANQHSLSGDQYWNQIKKQYRKSEQDIENIKTKIEDIITYSFVAGQQQVKPEKGFYHVWGIDVLVDESFNPWVFDIEYFPTLSPKTPAKKQAMLGLGEGVVELLVQLQKNWDDLDNFVKNGEFVQQDKFKVIYNQATDFNPLDKYLKSGSHSKDDL